MLAAYCKNEESSNCAKLLGTVTPAHEGGLISDNTSLISNNTSLISTGIADGGLDTCSFYSGPTDADIIAFGESGEFVSYEGSGESCGSIAFSGSGESCGSIASSGGSFSGGCCSYSC
ncbi:hypothetical protein IKQ21_08570 [bacterium]|nr:hypothetical protein [bacterium]